MILLFCGFVNTGFHPRHSSSLCFLFSEASGKDAKVFSIFWCRLADLFRELRRTPSSL